MPLKGLASPWSELEESLPSGIDRASPDLESVVGLLVDELTAERRDSAGRFIFCEGSDGGIRGSRSRLDGTFDTRSALGPVGGWKGGSEPTAGGSAASAAAGDMSTGGGGAVTIAAAGAAEPDGLRLSSGLPKAGTCGADGGELALERLESWTCFSDLDEK
jgi:hypothetical protein